MSSPRYSSLGQDANYTQVGTLQPVTPDQCYFAGPRYAPNGTFKQIPNINFNQSYGNGEIVTSPLGYSKLIFGDIAISKQEISSATYASLGGNSAGNVSGIIGLAFSNATNAYAGEDPSKDTLCMNTMDSTVCGPIPYSQILTTVFASNLSAPIFSFALSRSTTTGGTMAIGGIPQPDRPHINATTPASTLAATVPIEPFRNSTSLLVYATTASGFHYPKSVFNAGQGQYIVDTGTYPNILPRSEADKVNAIFDPPATFNSTGGYYTTLCNATAPPIRRRVRRESLLPQPQGYDCAGLGRESAVLECRSVVISDSLSTDFGGGFLEECSCGIRRGGIGDDFL
ncbi:MAG: hypothetical protein Q9160_008006 [Pyrenula sp. 1 TL-2023]